MADYDEQDDPDTATEILGALPNLTPEEEAWLDAPAAEGRRLALERMVLDWVPDPTRCARCCPVLPPDPSGEPYPVCDDYSDDANCART